jgi:peptide/nickel transport system substrate-binding protein
MKKLNLFIIVMTITGLLLMTACQPSTGGTTPGEVEPAQIEPAQTSEDSASMPELVLDPALLTNSAAAPYVYESLLKLENEQALPLLALAGTVSEDGLDFIITLRPGVTFHDGSVLNADAVLANFNRWFDPQDPYRGSGTYEAWVENFGGFKGESTSEGQPKSIFDGIEKVDDLTVLIHLNSPDLEFLFKLANPAFVIISPDYLVGGTEGPDGGTGPYVIGASTSSGQTLEPNPEYWNPAGIPTSSMEITP